MASETETPQTDWPLRSWILAILAALIALAIQQLSQLPDTGWEWGARMVGALIVFLGTSGLAFSLAWERGRLVGAVAVALFCGLIAGNVILWNGTPDGFFHGSDGWHLFCGIVTSGVILTLYQAARDGGATWPTGWSPSALGAWRHESIRYEAVHGHFWSNIVSVGLSGLFMLLSFGIAHLMAEMFWLVKLGFVRDLLRKDWFDALLCGAAFGTALGLLRDRGTIIALIRRVALIVLRVLAPVVALAVFVFLVALPFTGLEPLWETGGTTPIMLTGAMLALFLTNIVVSEGPETESRSIVMSSSAAALGLFLLPMVGIAAFSSGLRIQQYGLSPDRLWALIFIVVASITAIAYAVAILGRRGWFARLRSTNLNLAVLLGLIALLLSTPLVGIERISTEHQLARLAGGQVSPEDFDYRGLWFDFGPPGRAAIERLAKSSSDATVRRYAGEVRKLKNSWDDAPNQGATETGGKLDRRLTILPRPVPLDDKLRKRLIDYDACGMTGDACTLRYVPGQDFAIVIKQPSPRCDRCQPDIYLFKFNKGEWSSDRINIGLENVAATEAAIRAGNVQMRTVERRQIFIDGKPYGEVWPMTTEPASDKPEVKPAASPAELWSNAQIER